MSDVQAPALPPGGEEPESPSWAPIARMVIGVAVVIVIGVFIYFSVANRPADPVPSKAPIVSVETAAADIDTLTLSPDQLLALPPADAREWNAKLPFSTDRIRPVRPFVAPAVDARDYGRALDCLTAAVYYEAGNETPAGKLAVAQVVLNRVRHPVYPKSVCGVVFEGSERASGCQFTFTCDGSLARVPTPTGWSNARAVAQSALNGLVLATVGAATHYHADYVAPYWAGRLSKLAQIGTHIFYRFSGAWSDSPALSARYVGGEPVIAKMARLATPVADDATVDDLIASAPGIPEIDTALLDLASPEQPGAADGTRAASAPPPTAAPSRVTVTGPASSAPAPAPPTATQPQNPLTTPVQPARSRLARPGSW